MYGRTVLFYFAAASSTAISKYYAPKVTKALVKKYEEAYATYHEEPPAKVPSNPHPRFPWR